MNYKQLALFIALILFAVLLTLRECNLSKQRAELELQKQVLHDSLTVTTDKLGRQTASINLIQTDYKTFKALASAKEDSLLRKLQAIVTKRTISATIATQVMVIDTVLKTDTIYYAYGDTCNPVYVMNDTTPHRILNINAGRDSTSVKVRVYETLMFSQEWSKWRPFKKQECKTSYTTSNPDVQITGLRTYTVKCDCSKTGWFWGGVGFGGGGLLGSALGYLVGRGSK